MNDVAEFRVAPFTPLELRPPARLMREVDWLGKLAQRMAADATGTPPVADQEDAVRWYEAFRAGDAAAASRRVARALPYVLFARAAEESSTKPWNDVLGLALTRARRRDVPRLLHLWRHRHLSADQRQGLARRVDKLLRQWSPTTKHPLPRGWPPFVPFDASAVRDTLARPPERLGEWPGSFASLTELLADANAEFVPGTMAETMLVSHVAKVATAAWLGVNDLERSCAQAEQDNTRTQLARAWLDRLMRERVRQPDALRLPGDRGNHSADWRDALRIRRALGRKLGDLYGVTGALAPSWRDVSDETVALVRRIDLQHELGKIFDAFDRAAGERERSAFWRGYEAEVTDALFYDARGSSVCILVFGDLVVIEFGTLGNACFVYREHGPLATKPWLYSRDDGRTLSASDFKTSVSYFGRWAYRRRPDRDVLGHKLRPENRLVHQRGWKTKFEEALTDLAETRPARI